MKGFIFIIFTKYYYGVQCRRMKWAGHIMHMEEMRNAYKILVLVTSRKEITWQT